MQDTPHLQRKQVILRDKVRHQWLTVKFKQPKQSSAEAVSTYIIKYNHNSQRGFNRARGFSSVTSITDSETRPSLLELNPNVRWQWSCQIYLSTGSREEAHVSWQHSPLSCSVACDHPPCPHQTGSYTEADQCHPAILWGRGINKVSWKGDQVDSQVQFKVKLAK